MKKTMQKFLDQIELIGGEGRELRIEKPATLNEIIEIETALGYQLPPNFKDVLLNVSSHCEFKWFLADDFELPDELCEIFCGEIHWGLKFILPFNENKNSWIKKVFPDPNNEYDKVWHNKFVFQEVGNGDYLSIDLSAENYGKIVYLSHDGGEGHGYVMANSFNSLLKNWLPLGCPGGEDWQWLPFYDKEYGAINHNCANATLWKKTIGIL